MGETSARKKNIRNKMCKAGSRRSCARKKIKRSSYACLATCYVHCLVAWDEPQVIVGGLLGLGKVYKE